MGKHHNGEDKQRSARRGMSHLLAGSMLAGVLVMSAPGASAPIEAAGGCLDKLEIETPGEIATTFGTVTLAAGETFRADVKHWTSAPTARTWLTGFNSEMRLSPMLDDGFPGYASTSQRDSFAADGPWDVDGFMDDGTFSYTNTSSSSRSFVFEVGFWNHPADGIIGRTEASGFSTCVSPHSPPDRPTRDCVAAPTLVANGANVHSEPFEMRRNETISMRMVDERPLRYDDDGAQRPLLRSDYLIRAWLYGRNGPDDSWHYIRRDSHRSQNNWLRSSYVGSWDISLKNRSNYTEVKVIFGKWISRGYALSTPLDVSIRGTNGVWRSTCLTSTQTTVTWDTAPSCAADNTARIQAQVTNRSGVSTGYRISLVDTATGNQVHGSHFHTIDNGSTGTVALGGIPTGTWDLRVYEQQHDGTEALVGSAIRERFNRDNCTEDEPAPAPEQVSWNTCETGPHFRHDDIENCDEDFITTLRSKGFPVYQQGDNTYDEFTTNYNAIVYWIGPADVATACATGIADCNWDWKAGIQALLVAGGFIPIVGEVIDAGFCLYDAGDWIFHDGSGTTTGISCGSALLPFVPAALTRVGSEIAVTILRRSDEVVDNARNGSRGFVASPTGGMVFETGRNAAGGRIFTSVGAIDGDDIAPIVNAAVNRGDQVHILSGVHGGADGVITNADNGAAFFFEDIADFGNLPGVNVRNMAGMEVAEIQAILEGPGTIIAGFCDSRVCIDQFLPSSG